MKKKVISLMLIGAMVASMAACGSNGGDKGGTKDNDTSVAAEIAYVCGKKSGVRYEFI